MTGKPKRVRKAVLPVAGLGTRFLPATKAMPKEMLPVVDKPLIQYAVEECIDSGIENIIFVTGRRKYAIEDHFDSVPELEQFLEERGKSKQAKMVREISGGLHFSYTRQSEALGLGHAVLTARELVGDLQLLLRVQRDAGRLLAVTQRRVEDQYSVGVVRLCHVAIPWLET